MLTTSIRQIESTLNTSFFFGNNRFHVSAIQEIKRKL